MNDDPCGVGGASWLYELDPVTGAMPVCSIFDLGATPLTRMAVRLIGATKSAIFLRDYAAATGVALAQDIRSRTDSLRFRIESGGPPGRVSWREIIE